MQLGDTDKSCRTCGLTREGMAEFALSPTQAKDSVPVAEHPCEDLDEMLAEELSSLLDREQDIPESAGVDLWPSLLVELDKPRNGAEKSRAEGFVGYVPPPRSIPAAHKPVIMPRHVSRSTSPAKDSQQESPEKMAGETPGETRAPQPRPTPRGPTRSEDFSAEIAHAEKLLRHANPEVRIQAAKKLKELVLRQHGESASP
jgi:hypothetical protein